MSDAVSDFFEGLARNGARMLRQISGTVRFDLDGPDGVEHWLAAIDQGRITVGRGGAEDADTVINADRELFLRMARGEVKPVPAWLRNDFTADGDFRLVMVLERLFAPPPGARHPRAAAGRQQPTGGSAA
ncbi:SCP2 sterol-binding domain-containing protein [Micromonospora radicis]|uniref:Sterol-binding protein n=1 Tax=Micromonospora radicis TaxID=1894971 RepID=A0A418N1R3_9ACTN|nr:SCP2 sterol-binding domain-containing protein [Micromonospora radicis]RIV41451.1 sterol-binding protein [Micromonospora radicis]